MKIRIRPSFLLYLCCVWLFASAGTCLSVLTALFVHELSHLLTARALGESIGSVELTPFGGLMTYRKTPSKGIKGVLVAASGPLGNYVLLLLFSITAVQAAAGEELVRQMLAANLSMLLLNLMPALPLDGGRLLFSLGYYLFDVSRLIACLCALGIALGTGLVALGVYGALHLGILNASLLIVGLYLIACAKRIGPVMLAENLCTVIHERLMRRDAPAHLSLYEVPPEIRLCEMIPLISRTRAAAFFIEEKDGMRLIPERMICEAMLEDPNASLSALVENRD